MSAAGPSTREVSSLEVLKDNLEAFAIAIVIALVIKHFCLEAFKIPTGSMTPTLRGDDATGGGGDRILVDKLAYLDSDPKRWDVLVFRYPLDASRNFIKRVAGLPRERVRIVQGDIWTRQADGGWAIATKPRRPRDELTTTVWPPVSGVLTAEDRRRTLESAFESETPNAWRVESPDRFEFAGGSSAALVYKPTIRTGSNASAWEGAGGPAVHDARFRATFRASKATTVSMAWRSSAERLAEVRVSTEGFGPASAAAVHVAGTSQERAIAVRLVPGKSLDLEMECVDGEVIVTADGEEVARLPLARRIDEPQDYNHEGQRFTLRAAGGPMTVEGLRIGHDLWYTDDGMSALDRDKQGLEIPSDAYFMLGDNTEHSSDSRKWMRECLVLRDGRRICWDGSKSGSSVEPSTWRAGQEGRPPADLLAHGGTVRHVVDVEGVERWWLEEDEDPERAIAPVNVPFVRRSMVVGRAFFIFWPVLPGFPGRLRFIH